MAELVTALDENRVQEVFGAGTACVVCPVNRVTYGDRTLHIPTMENGPKLATRFLETLNGIQYGTISKPEWQMVVWKSERHFFVSWQKLSDLFYFLLVRSVHVYSTALEAPVFLFVFFFVKILWDLKFQFLVKIRCHDFLPSNFILPFPCYFFRKCRDFASKFVARLNLIFIYLLRLSESSTECINFVWLIFYWT